mmetsp:Transcript_35716/g.79445  ORF Transcript_35716/g.79445 Transcript_35716/m.79445 type:complete len:112 (-) Transcript_35716:1348-1683(-)
MTQQARKLQQLVQQRSHDVPRRSVMADTSAGLDIQQGATTVTRWLNQSSGQHRQRCAHVLRLTMHISAWQPGPAVPLAALSSTTQYPSLHAGAAPKQGYILYFPQTCTKGT